MSEHFIICCNISLQKGSRFLMHSKMVAMELIEACILLCQNFQSVYVNIGGGVFVDSVYQKLLILSNCLFKLVENITGVGYFLNTMYIMYTMKISIPYLGSAIILQYNSISNCIICT